MARIAGVTTQKDSKGNPAIITINLKKHPEAVPVLKNLGLIEKSDLRKEVEANPENFMTVDECFDNVQAHVKETWKAWQNSK